MFPEGFNDHSVSACSLSLRYDLPTIKFTLLKLTQWFLVYLQIVHLSPCSNSRTFSTPPPKKRNPVAIK